MFKGILLANKPLHMYEDILVSRITRELKIEVQTKKVNSRAHKVKVHEFKRCATTTENFLRWIFLNTFQQSWGHQSHNVAF